MSQKPGTSSKQQAGIRSAGLSSDCVVRDLMSIGPMRIVGASTDGDVLTCLLDGSEDMFSLGSEILLDLISSAIRMGYHPFLGFQDRH
jgi:hypothetical protein